ncbi:hypothetical protein BDR05DRAFT_985238, partial [Suillus weaverae]
MFWSDATHLTQFGNASTWPVYLFFGNQSKYACACPTTNACHPITFIPSNISNILTHCKRELFRALWRILLDDEFVDAYRNGVVIKCYDGVSIRKKQKSVLLAALRDKGDCPCPQCFLPKSCFNQLGLKADISARIKSVRLYLRDKIVVARKAIYQLGAPIKGTAAECLLKEFSLVQTLNTFTERLGHLGLDFFPILVVDLLHEFELRVFKSILKHLIRLLYAINHEAVALLDERFRSIPSFRKGAIQCFPSNISDMKQRAAQHFEDILQCAIPAFEGLFPDSHDEVV